MIQQVKKALQESCVKHLSSKSNIPFIFPSSRPAISLNGVAMAVWAGLPYPHGFHAHTANSHSLEE